MSAIIELTAGDAGVRINEYQTHRSTARRARNRRLHLGVGDSTVIISFKDREEMIEFCVKHNFFHFFHPNIDKPFIKNESGL